MSRPLTRLAAGALAGVAVLAPACVQIRPEDDFARARELAARSTSWSDAFESDLPLLSASEVAVLLGDGLTLAEALQIALRKNRELQAEFREIGIAQADWVQAQLLSNPRLDVGVLFPSGGGRSLVEALVGFELLELWRIPVREEAARQELEATVLRIARAAAERLADTRRAYYAAVTAEELRRVAEEGVELARRSLQAVSDMQAAGAADALDEHLARGPLLLARLALEGARSEVVRARHALLATLSLDDPSGSLALVDAVPKPDATPVDVERLVQQALQSRLDVRALASEVAALEQREELERLGAWGDASAGPSVERPAESGATLIGPAVSVTLPLFDRNQAQIARAGHRLAQMIDLHESARISVARDVRAAAERLAAASEALHFFDEELLPGSEQALLLARQSYAAGRTSLLSLLEVQRHVLEARQARVTLQLETALSAAELESAVGAPLNLLPDAPAAGPGG